MSLINRKEVRKRILERAKDTRKGWECKQVSKSALDTIEAKLSNMIDRAIYSHPSIGKTFKEII